VKWAFRVGYKKRYKKRLAMKSMCVVSFHEIGKLISPFLHLKAVA